MGKYCVYAKIAIHEYAKNEQKAAEVVERLLLEQEKISKVEVLAVEKDK